MKDIDLMLVPLSAVQLALARVLGTIPRSVTPDAIAEVAGSIEWRPTAGWDSQREDHLIASNAGLFEVGFSGDTLIVTDPSFAPDLGAFQIEAADLPRFVAEYLARYGESFFDGDVVIVEARGKRIWLFHHAGVHAWRA